jgi:hypothetical protein
MRTYFDVLGVHPNADEEEIKSAYRKLAKAIHPDVNFTDQRATKRFIEINEAYDVLKDAESRAAYRQYLSLAKARSINHRRDAAIVFAGLVLISGVVVLAAPFLEFPAPREEPGDHALVASDQPSAGGDAGASPRTADAGQSGGAPPASVSLPVPAAVSPETEQEGSDRAAGHGGDGGDLATAVIARAQPEATEPVSTTVVSAPPAATASKETVAPEEPANPHSDSSEPLAATANEGTVAAAEPVAHQHESSELVAASANKETIAPAELVTPPPAATASEGTVAAAEPIARPAETPAPLQTGTEQVEVGSIAAVSTSKPARTWATYRNARYKFALDYPTDLFLPVEAPPGDDIRQFETRDGRARLVITSNSSRNATLESVRRVLMREKYRGAAFDYMPLGKSWFVLSGTQGETMFYERLTFVCGERLSHGWQLTYPAAERALYDAIVERIHRSYKFRTGADAPADGAANCSTGGKQGCAEPWLVCTSSKEQTADKQRKGQDPDRVWP